MQPQQPGYGGQPAPAPNYDFIMSPGQPKKRAPFSFGGGNSTLMRVIVALVGLLILIIIISVVKSALGGDKSNVVDLNQVLESQQELVHIAGNSTQGQTTLNSNNQNFAITVQLALASQQGQLETYMQTNHDKVNKKLLNAKVSATVDTELTNSVAAGTYNSTFSQVMQSELTDYVQTLKAAYNLTPGPKGRALLSADYNGAQLLQQQLTSQQG